MWLALGLWWEEPQSIRETKFTVDNLIGEKFFNLDQNLPYGVTGEMFQNLPNAGNLEGSLSLQEVQELLKNQSEAEILNIFEEIQLNIDTYRQQQSTQRGVELKSWNQSENMAIYAKIKDLEAEKQNLGYIQHHLR